VSFSEFQARHVLCFLGPTDSFSQLARSFESAIDEYAHQFEIDWTYSQNTSDSRMPDSFDVSWDRVNPNAVTEEDARAVREHGCVIYVLGPLMNTENAVEISALALRLVIHALNSGATAAKGESAGVAHGVKRWRQMASNAEQSAEPVDLARACRLAFAKRPLADGKFLCSLGFHLVGLPEVYVPTALSNDDLALSSMIDGVADDLFRLGTVETLSRHGAILLPVVEYDEDDFKYNPYGAIYVDAAKEP
jgi:hypothetical protein